MDCLRPYLATLVGACVLVALGCSGGRDSATSTSTPRNLLFIVVDSLRADHLSTYGHGRASVAIDRLAREGTTFERAHASAPWTKPSVATMFTGLHPTSHGVTNTEAILSDDVETLAEVLLAAGYRTSAVVSHHLIGRKFRFHQGFESFDQDAARGHRFISSALVTQKASAVLAAAAVQSAPFFLFAHYFDPHYDYRDHANIAYAKRSAGRLDGSQGIGQLRRMLSDMTTEERDFLRDRYDEEIRFTDRAIGRLLARLDGLGLAEDTLVVFTADHGEEFGGRGWLGHTQSLYRELVRVPLVMRGPDVAIGARVNVPVSLVALAPTVLELMGLESSSTAYQATSFAARLTGEETPYEPVFCEVDYLGAEEGKPGVPTCRKKAIVGERYKLIRDDRSGRVELYDMAGDPGEERDLGAEHPGVVVELVALLERHLAALGEDRHETESVEYTEEELRALQELGYVGDDH